MFRAETHLIFNFNNLAEEQYESSACNLHHSHECISKMDLQITLTGHLLQIREQWDPVDHLDLLENQEVM